MAASRERQLLNINTDYSLEVPLHENDLVEIIAPRRSTSSALLCPSNAYEDLKYDDSEDSFKSIRSQTINFTCDYSDINKHSLGNDEITSNNLDSDETHVEPNCIQENSNDKFDVEKNNLVDALDKFSIESDKLIERSHSLDSQDDVHSKVWRNQCKHIFILSESGKPIYSRHGNEDNLVTIMGVMQALVSFIHVSKDTIRSIHAGDHKFTFLVRDHLILVAVSKDSSSTNQLLLQLSYVHNQIVAILTLSQLSHIFTKRRNYDLRRLLSGTEKFIDHLLNRMEENPCFMLGAIQCLPLDPSIRDTVTQTIVQHCRVKDLVFAIVLANQELVSLVRMKKYHLHTVDLHLLINLIGASDSFKSVESWTPVCLPKFDSSGFLHAYISYLDEDCHICLIMLTVDKEAFYTLASCRQKIHERLQRHRCLEAINESLLSCKYTTSECFIPELRHFIYMSHGIAQYTSPEIGPPYTTKEQKDRLFGLYQYLHHTIHSSNRPLKILYHAAKYETLLGWVTSAFELYVVFGPLVTKPATIHAVNKLLRWIEKESDRLFIVNYLTF